MYFWGICTEYWPQRNFGGGGGEGTKLAPNTHPSMWWPCLIILNPFTATACKMFGLNCTHIHTSKHYIWWSYNKSTFNVYSRPHVKGAKKPYWFESWHFCWLFSSWWRGNHGSERVKWLLFFISVSLSVPHLHEIIVGHMWPVLMNWVLTRSQLTVVQAKAASGGHWSHCWT